MGCACNRKSVSQEKQIAISAMSAALFYIVANPDTFRLVRHIFGKWVAGAGGCPTRLGLGLHALVFFLATWGLMNVKK